MFPPKPTHNPQELLNNLWMSVQRAGPVFTGDANIIPKGDKQSCSICLAPGTLMHEVKHALRRYIKAYAKDSGWYLSDIRFEKSYLAFSIELSSAASSLSQKPSAKR
jgi:hypothetical protein